MIPQTAFLLSSTLCQKQKYIFSNTLHNLIPIKCQVPLLPSQYNPIPKKWRTVTYQNKMIKKRRISGEDEIKKNKKIYQKIINNTKRQNYCAIIEVHKRIELEINCFFYINSGIEYSLKVMFYFCCCFFFLIPLENWRLLLLIHWIIHKFFVMLKTKKWERKLAILCYFQFQALTFILNFYSFGKHWKGTIFACKLSLVPVWNLIYCFFRWHNEGRRSTI